MKRIIARAVFGFALLFLVFVTTLLGWLIFSAFGVAYAISPLFALMLVLLCISIGAAFALPWAAKVLDKSPHESAKP